VTASYLKTRVETFPEMSGLTGVPQTLDGHQKSLSFFLKTIFHDFVAILNFPKILLNLKKKKR
jgi:hypothetical protein